MRDRSPVLGGYLPWLALTALTAASLQTLHLAGGTAFSGQRLVVHLAFVAGVPLAASVLEPCAEDRAHAAWPWLTVAVAGAGVLTAVVYASSRATWAAWSMLVALDILLMGVDTALTQDRGVLWRWCIRVFLALAAGSIAASIAQIESQFAEEEFFVALQALALSLLWLLLLGIHHVLPPSRQWSRRQVIQIDNRWLSAVLLMLALAGLGGTLSAYQRSFYPSAAPSYPGVSREEPFICDEVAADSQTFTGEDIFQRLLARVEANPLKRTQEYGMLALGTKEQHWARLFRDTLLDEAAEGRYTSPAHSVKSVQYEAALRAYYFPRVQASFPGLFSDDDVAMVREWFAAINRRALTVEWVDWMYGLAFSKWPEGPYENQENGAGLLAVLETEGLAAPELSSANRDYLDRNQRGWVARFRNTDDALVYQPEWINNAYFQSLYTGTLPERNGQLSFEWLLAQALPDGSPLRYNHPGRLSLAGVAYLGADLLQDPRYLWLAGRALEYAESEGNYLYAQPGVEAPIHLESRSPSKGSCLLYGGSGLPNQVGPLAPDKIVFRDDWSEDATYLLLNLRFSGWHRYKASNTITLVYQEGRLAADVLDGKPFQWLPTGRSLFRDKRIPRENLNGLTVERTGMSSVLYVLTGFGGPWAQDPPHYADVIGFQASDSLDWSHTRLTDWRGWQHNRQVYFYHDRGPIVVVDEAAGPSGGQAALAWHLSAGEMSGKNRIHLQTDAGPVNVLFVPLHSEQLEVAPQAGESSLVQARYYAVPDGYLQAATVFLSDQWADAEALHDEETDSLLLTNGQTTITVPLRVED